MVKLSTTLNLSLGLSQRHQQKLNREWNGVVSDPEAFAPHEKRGKVPLEEIIQWNMRLGDFASERLKQIFRASSTEDKLRRIQGKKKIVAVGFGLGYDCRWLEEAILAGYEVWWVDVSDLACDMAKSNMSVQFEKLRTYGILHPAPVVKQGEIQSILADPDVIGLELSSVEIWYFCRTLTCLSKRSARVVLQQIGSSCFSEESDPEGHNRIEVVSAMRDYNPTRIGARSKIYRIRDILANVRRGARRPVEAVGEATTKYFDQIYTGVSICAK